jgi:hypothetical protein
MISYTIGMPERTKQMLYRDPQNDRKVITIGRLLFLILFALLLCGCKTSKRSTKNIDGYTLSMPINDQSFRVIIIDAETGEVFKQRDGITLSTIHGEKVAEFNTVIAFALLQDYVPHSSDTDIYMLRKNYFT